MAAQPLTPDMLDRFGEALSFAGAPLGEDFLPGLTDAAIDGLGESLGVTIPPELRTLWRWRMPPAHSNRRGALDINPEWEYWPPRSVAEVTNYVRSIEFPPPRPLVAFAGFGLSVLMVEAGSQSPTSPVVEFMFDDPDQLQIAPSLGALISFWSDQMLSEDYWFDPAEGWSPDDIPMVRIIQGDGLWRPEP